MKNENAYGIMFKKNASSIVWLTTFKTAYLRRESLAVTCSILMEMQYMVQQLTLRKPLQINRQRVSSSDQESDMNKTLRQNT